MKTTGRWGGTVGLTGLLGAAVVLSRTTAFGAMYITPAGASDSDGSVDASASIVAGNGTVTVTLTDLLQNPLSSGETLSGIKFTVSGATATATLASSAGLTSTIKANGTYTPGVFTDPLSHWGAQNDVNLSTIGIVGHMPDDLIVGPDSAGGFTGAGRYTHANGGFDNFDPYVLGSATFTVDVAGVTSGSTLSAVTFEFGTVPEFVTGALVSVVPEPAAYGALAGVGLLLVSLGSQFRRQQA